jgi:hypothetical protein
VKGEAEVNYSHVRYLPFRDVERAFGVSLPVPNSIGWYQPNPYSTKFATLWLMFAGALVVLAFAIFVIRHGLVVYNENITFGHAPETTGTAQPQWGAGSDPTRVVFTKPFTLAGGRNVRVEGFSNVNNAWVHVGCDLINQQGAIVDSFVLPIEYYSGYDGGEHWTEGGHVGKAYLSALPAGSYTMRLEGDWDKSISYPSVLVTVDEGVFRWSHFWIALALLTIPPVFALYRYNVFETQRWADSMFTRMGLPR